MVRAAAGPLSIRRHALSQNEIQRALLQVSGGGRFRSDRGVDWVGIERVVMDIQWMMVQIIYGLVKIYRMAHKKKNRDKVTLS